MIEVLSSDPLSSTQISLPLPKLPTIAGNYVLELLYENISLGAHRVKISEIDDATSN
jgi:hypothetical protein